MKSEKESRDRQRIAIGLGSAPSVVARGPEPLPLMTTASVILKCVSGWLWHIIKEIRIGRSPQAVCNSADGMSARGVE